MPVDVGELIEALSVLADDCEIRVAVKNSLMSSFIVAGTTLIGAIVMGGKGVVAGAATGAGLALAVCGNFKSVSSVIRNDMNEEQKQKLYRHIAEAFKEFGVRDIISAIALIQGNKQARESAVRVIKAFMENELKMRIID